MRWCVRELLGRVSCWACEWIYLARAVCSYGVGVMKETNSILFMEVFMVKQNWIWKAGCALSANECPPFPLRKGLLGHAAHLSRSSENNFSTAILFDYTPNRLSGSLSIILGFPPFPVFLSFACRHLVGLVLSTLPAMPLRIRQAMCSTSKQNLHRL